MYSVFQRFTIESIIHSFHVLKLIIVGLLRYIFCSIQHFSDFISIINRIKLKEKKQKQNQLEKYSLILRAVETYMCVFISIQSTVAYRIVLQSK